MDHISADDLKNNCSVIAASTEFQRVLSVSFQSAAESQATALHLNQSTPAIGMLLPRSGVVISDPRSQPYAYDVPLCTCAFLMVCHVLQVMSWFWATVAGYSREEMSRLLQFTTGSTQLPPGGFASLQPQFTITISPTARNSLPRAQTCFNRLCLPFYDSPQRLQGALLTALHEGNEGFAFS